MEELRVSCPKCNGTSNVNVGRKEVWCPNCEDFFKPEDYGISRLSEIWTRDNIK